MTTRSTPNDQDKPTQGAAISNESFRQLLAGSRQLLVSTLSERISELFGQVDQTLFEAADQAESNQVQTLFFDSMREIRSRRGEIERHYLRLIAQKFSDFLEGKIPPPREMENLEADSLSLVQNEEYEESLIITNMVRQVNGRCVQQLFTLEQRLAVINNGRKPSEEANPYGARNIAQAFREALSEHTFNPRIKQMLYVLFEQTVMSCLDELYSTLNKRLIEAGILPNLKYSARRTPNAAAPSPQAPAPHNAEQPAPADALNSAPNGQAQTVAPAANGTTGMPAGPAGLNGTAAQGQAPAGTPGMAPGATAESATLQAAAQAAAQSLQLLSNLTSLIQTQRQQAPQAPIYGQTRSISAYSPSDAQESFSLGELFGALDRMQQENARELPQNILTPQKVAPLKESLHQDLQKHSAKPGKVKVSDDEADVIDLVGMLFDFILDDNNLPDTFKTLLSHLHTPYLKIALHDKALFSDPQHPARSLLNNLAQAGVLYGDSDDNQPLQSKIQWMVEKVIHEFNGDLDLLAKLSGELDDFLTSQSRQAELVERRAVEAARGREKLLQARQDAEAQILQLLDSKEPPLLIRNFLELTWVDVLVFIQLRQGVASTDWKNALQVASELVRGGTPLEAVELASFKSKQAQLLEQVRQGLEQVGGYQEDGIRRLLTDLSTCFHAIQAKAPQIADKIKHELPPSHLGSLLGDDLPVPPSQHKGKPLSPEAQAHLRELENIEFGTWFEIVHNNRRQPLKLSWFSPTTRKYMFVDQAGHRSLVMSIEDLAQALSTDQASIIEPERKPLVDRALGTIYKVLKRLTGRQTAPAV
ncbi:DUF1631 domain-containing protein [Atopomonas sediminilitoris]|uniref:DUF1631 domain-containing protein n=1 Tax=Atopomonas sediminilitoris TaxID=2919919 RepID=UPI001F4E68C4|nr:DUF1631 domain-containing protein [Atopomonas sediminilitoris]MCJ8169879.1 DUF1631 domain-containing protein [Atopomonas sediminilitoris]